jgi:hypothetical protein
MKKEIPTVIQTFSEVINKGMIYVDKTKYIYNPYFPKPFTHPINLIEKIFGTIFAAAFNRSK